MTQEEYKLNFGKFKGKTLLEIAKDSPSYLLWIAGVKNKFSMTAKGQEFYAVICKDNPEDVQAAKQFVEGRCFQCWTAIPAGEKHFCKGMQAKSNYHYHPYGKRT
jgi:hypothetical protein